MKPAWKRLSPPQAPDYMIRELNNAIRSLQWDPGKRVKTLEARIARELDVPPEWVLTTDSCTTALAVASKFVLKGSLTTHGACGTSEAKVSVCPLTWPSTYCHVPDHLINWMDCNDDGWPIDRVDIGVELWGRPFPDALLPVTILDAAHRVLDRRHGDLLKSDMVRAVCYSFNCQKEIPCLRGGALVSKVAGEKQVRAFLTCGTQDRRYMGAGGIKGGLPDPLAAWILKGINRLSRTKSSRQRVLRQYADHLGRLVVTRPGEASGHLCVLRCSDRGHRKLIRALLARHGVETGRHYILPAGESVSAAAPNAAELSERIISVPCHPEMTNYDVRRVARLIASA